MDNSREEIGIEEARKALGAIAESAHSQGTLTYLTRYGRPIAAVVPVGSKASAIPKSAIDAAMDAAWATLPDGFTREDARRRTVSALNAAHPHLAGLLDQARRQGEVTAQRGARERMRQYGRDTGDARTARVYERLVAEEA